MNANDHCIDICNKLLRGERSAVETYDQALQKYGNRAELQDLRLIRDDHMMAVRRLEENVLSMNGTPDQDAGAWGTFANTVQGAANLFGADSAMEALQNGERAGRSDYQAALGDDEVMPGCKEMISADLLPRIEQHIVALEHLQKAA